MRIAVKIARRLRDGFYPARGKVRRTRPTIVPFGKRLA